MAPSRKDEATPAPRRPPATTPAARENQLISDAYALAERQIRDGTASSQVITHFLKMGTTREALEKEKLAREVELLKSKTDSMESGKKIEAMYSEALIAMRTYQGQEVEADNDY